MGTNKRFSLEHSPIHWVSMVSPDETMKIICAALDRFPNAVMTLAPNGEHDLIAGGLTYHIATLACGELAPEQTAVDHTSIFFRSYQQRRDAFLLVFPDGYRLQLEDMTVGAMARRHRCSEDTARQSLMAAGITTAYEPAIHRKSGINLWKTL